MSKKILIAVADYYKEISSNLLDGAKKTIQDKNNNYTLDIIKAPGCFEIPFLIKKNIHKYDGFIALGCIIRGETYHFELIANECSNKIMQLSTEFIKPIGFGVLTCENIEQAIQRSHPNKGNKGHEAANACLYLLD